VFDLGLTKLAVIGVVALVVIGPEKLPKVARTVGTLLGRAQRYLADVKAEVNREMQIDELRAMRDHVQSAASSFESSVHGSLRQTEADLNAAFETSPIASQPAPQPDHEMMPLAASMPVPPAKRNKWRRNVTQRTSATPLWFRAANRKRTRVQSGAARIARYRVR
jgi:sec-independent protein translocase protein TatB